jgi:hypothetical protein
MAQEGYLPCTRNLVREAPRRPRRAARATPQEVYEGDQRGLLDLLLEEFPGVLTYREALVARATDPEDFGEVDRFSSAAAGLVASGLLVRQGELMIPSQPAREMVGLGFELG